VAEEEEEAEHVRFSRQEPPRFVLNCQPGRGARRRVWPGGAGWRGRRGSAAPRDRTDGTPRGTGCVGVRPMGSRGSYPALSGCLGCGGIKRGVAIGCQREPRLVLAATSDAQAWRMAGSDRSVQRFYMILLVRRDCALVPSGKDRDGRWRSVRDQHEYLLCTSTTKSFR
jgi:hypothetical protein